MNDELSGEKVELCLLTRVRNRVEECYQIAEKHYGEKFPRSTINFTLKGTKAGTENLGKRLLRFNRKLLVENTDYFMSQTIPHEVAHSVQESKFGIGQTRSHGKEWRVIMVDVFKLSPKVKHSLDVTNVLPQKRTYKYICPACPDKFFEVGSIKHLKISRGNLIYCPNCGKNLVWEGRTSVPLTEEELD